jgi:LysM repeat protein
LIKRVLIATLSILTITTGIATPDKKARRTQTKKVEVSRKSSSKSTRNRTKTVVSTVKVQKGDNEWDIAKRSGMSVRDLRKMNGGKSLAKIKPGQKLEIEKANSSSCCIQDKRDRSWKNAR